MKTILLSSLTLVLICGSIYAQNEATKEQERGATKLDLNTASERALSELPGVGPLGAKAIIAGRPYASVSDLAAHGIKQEVIDRIAPLVTASSAPPTPNATSNRTVDADTRRALRLRH